jgi:hypothetical protein
MDIRSILNDHGIEDARTSTIDMDIGDVNQRITDLNQFVSGAFYDGIVQEIEAKKIQAYINSLNESNKKVTEQYTVIYNNEALYDGAVKDELFAAKSDYDLNYNRLISDINMAISDGISTLEEAEQVDESYLYLMDSSARLERALEVARDTILGKRTSIAEQNAIGHAEEIKTGILEITDDIDERLLSMEGYVDGTFRDGVVTEFEAKNIQSYIDSLRMQKTQLDKKYTEVYNNYFLSGIPKINLADAKAQYDTRHDALIAIIILAISDSKATPEESDNVRQGFVELDVTLSLLVMRFEIAVDSLSQARADEAERLAKEGAAEYTDRQVGVVDAIIKEIVADEIITSLERSTIKDDITKITGVILGDTDNMPDIATIDLSNQGEVYFARNEAITTGLAADHLDVLALEDAYTTLAIYLNAMTPKPWDVTSTDIISVDKVVWRTNWMDYYLAISVLRLRIAEKIKYDRDDVVLKLESVESTITEHTNEIVLRVLTETYEEDMDALNKKVEQVETNLGYDCEVHSTNGYYFKNGEVSTTIYAVVYRGVDNVTDLLSPSQFNWKRISSDTAGDAEWNNAHVNIGKQFTVTKDDVYARATFACDITIETTT